MMMCNKWNGSASLQERLQILFLPDRNYGLECRWRLVVVTLFPSMQQHTTSDASYVCLCITSLCELCILLHGSISFCMAALVVIVPSIEHWICLFNLHTGKECSIEA